MKRGELKEHNENEIVLKLKTELDILKKYIKKDVSLPIVASFGFIIALVWKDAISITLDEFLSKTYLPQGTCIYEIVSAIIVTFLIMIVMVLVTEFSKSRKTKKIGKEVAKAKREIIKYSDKKNQKSKANKKSSKTSKKSKKKRS